MYIPCDACFNIIMEFNIRLTFSNFKVFTQSCCTMSTLVTVLFGIIFMKLTLSADTCRPDCRACDKKPSQCREDGSCQYIEIVSKDNGICITKLQYPTNYQRSESYHYKLCHISISEKQNIFILIHFVFCI